MPARMLRAGLFDSTRFIDLADTRAQLCFVACISAADDFGNLEAGPGDLRRRWRDFGADSLDEVARILALLTAADLLRTYESAGKRYVHIPRFRQRLRHEKHAHPRPPAEKDTHINKEDDQKTSDARQTHDGRTADERPTHVGRREVKGSEVKKFKNRAGEARPVDNFSAAPAKPAKVNGRQRIAEGPKINGNGAGHGPQRLDLGAALAKGIKPPAGWRTNPQAAATYAGTLGMSTMPGESLAALVARVDRVLALRDA